MLALRVLSVRGSLLSRAGINTCEFRRFLSLHEYQSVQLLNSYGVETPRSLVAKTASDAYELAQTFQTNPLVVKAQVLAGGRGKGCFNNGFRGGVHIVHSAEEAQQCADQMIGSRLVTKQTGDRGKPCHAVMLAEYFKPVRECYVAILNDRESEGPVLIASPHGGVNIEEVAVTNPDAIFSHSINPLTGIDTKLAVQVAAQLGLSPQAQTPAIHLLQRLYTVFQEKDATQIEINPLVETEDGRVLCMDAKFAFDDNAEFRQRDIYNLRDTSQEEQSEVEAQKYGLNFIKLDGDVGCLVNGAGLAMATMDVLSLHGGRPANFLDVGGGATPETVKHAFKILLADHSVKAIFINIFGGIMRCDYIAQGVINATNQLDLTIPLVVRLKGTKEQEAKRLIEESGLKIYAFDGLDEAAAHAVQKAQA